MRPIDRKRAQAKQIRKNLTDKVSRVRRSYGVELSGTVNDPRLPNAQIERMNSRQLTAYLNGARRFLDRDTTFIPAARGFLPGAEWHKYKRLERQFNELATTHGEQFQKMKLPGQDRTVAERDADIREGRTARQMAADATNRPLEAIERKPENIANARALRRLTADLEKRLKPGFYEKSLKAQRSQARKMLKIIGSENLTKYVLGERKKQADGTFKQVGGLTDQEFDFLWNYGTLANDLSARMGDSDQGRAVALDPGFQNVRERAEEDILGDDWQEVFEQFRKG